ncbi:MAG: hypothetical protein HWN66_07705 [Candidatus Helarchaeota archaeon]|nr:hypothetical protein [Candidatus Helarchaeota archaeon]
MKLQQITRGKGKYYHVYLPKNIIEHVLHWHQGDNLEYKVISDNSIILKKLLYPVNKYLEDLSCPVCFNHCVTIKGIKIPKRNEFKIVARCPLDHLVTKTFFSQRSLAEWKWYIHETINICDLCGGFLEEEVRKHASSTVRPFYKIVFRCRDCGRTRSKVIADEIVDLSEKPPDDITPPIIQKNQKIRQKSRVKVCPTCEEEVPSNHVFCSQCGTFLTEEII